MPNTKPSCPAATCRAPESPQKDVATGTLEAAGVIGAWMSSARRCSHCGCVYSTDGTTKTIRGYLDNPIFTSGWRPIFGAK
jgi:hypothetical protein